MCFLLFRGKTLHKCQKVITQFSSLLWVADAPALSFPSWEGKIHILYYTPLEDKMSSVKAATRRNTCTHFKVISNVSLKKKNQIAVFLITVGRGTLTPRILYHLRGQPNFSLCFLQCFTVWETTCLFENSKLGFTCPEGGFHHTGRSCSTWSFFVTLFLAHT